MTDKKISEGQPTPAPLKETGSIREPTKEPPKIPDPAYQRDVECREIRWLHRDD